MISCKKIDEAMSIYVRPQTNPIAIKMLSDGDEIPENAQRPLKDYGAPFTLCQVMALVRKEGLTFVLNKDEQSCGSAMVGLGMVRPEPYLSGKYATVPMNQSTEARNKKAMEMSRFEYGRFKSILISPVKSADFDPDVIIFYGTGAQVMRMIQGATFESGEYLTSRAVGCDGCISPIVTPIVEGRCNYSIPGNGERRCGLVADGEIVFSMPKNRFEEVVTGLELSHQGGQTYPVSSGFLKLPYRFLGSDYAGLLKELRDSAE